ncbi:MAG: hypothetical protein MZV70_77600 [Desulfobacterales bacterium]|nr:hypothetical protein [Desulfobacterales bacterium]
MTVRTITLAEATALVGGNVYANADKHTGALLGNMVKRGLLIRVKAGVFSLPNAKLRQAAAEALIVSGKVGALYAGGWRLIKSVDEK